MEGRYPGRLLSIQPLPSEGLSLRPPNDYQGIPGEITKYKYKFNFVEMCFSSQIYTFFDTRGTSIIRFETGQNELHRSYNTWFQHRLRFSCRLCLANQKDKIGEGNVRPGNSMFQDSSISLSFAPSSLTKSVIWKNKQASIPQRWPISPSAAQRRTSSPIGVSSCELVLDLFPYSDSVNDHEVAQANTAISPAIKPSSFVIPYYQFRPYRTPILPYPLHPTVPLAVPRGEHLLRQSLQRERQHRRVPARRRLLGLFQNSKGIWH